ncbi:MAG TPA: hypothetical protein VMM80_10035 [Bacteroidota bacterium]|nr:hypothetical protein [Bacteroidota bacterium]
MKLLILVILPLALAAPLMAQAVDPPANLRGTSTAERKGMHDANNMRTEFWNFGMVGNYPPDPLNVDLTTFHSVEVPKGSGVNYSDGTTPFVLAQIDPGTGIPVYIMETGYRERQAQRTNGQMMRFEPRPGYFQASTAVNVALSPAISNDPRTWPSTWPDKDHSWDGAWDGYFGKRPAADQESFTVMDDDFYDDKTLWPNYHPDSRDLTRHGLGMRVEVRGFQWSNIESQDVIFWHYDITNEGTIDYPHAGQAENIIFGLYMDSGVGGSAISCDGIAESDDDNAFYDNSYAGLNLVYTWDLKGHGVGLGTLCATTGYVGYAYLETPGKPYDGIDNDRDGIIDESRASGPGQKIVGQTAIAAYVNTSSRYRMEDFVKYNGKLEDRPAFKSGVWWTGDEDLDWVADYDDVGADGVPNTHDIGEGDGIPTAGEPDFDQTDPDESDQIGLTGFKMNRISPGKGNPDQTTDGIIFFTNALDWPHRLYQKFTDPDSINRFDYSVVNNYNIAFLFASGPFTLKSGDHERFSLALAYGADLTELKTVITVVEAIYNANYQFSTPPPTPTVKADAGDHYVQLTWDDLAENATNPITRINAFEGYKIYRSTDPTFLDPKVISNGQGTGMIALRPSAQFDLKDGREGYTPKEVLGVAYYLGTDNGLTHSWRDTSVTNGQQYYYAVCSYDWGPTLSKGTVSFTYYPSESPITVHQELLGGIILPINVVSVRPNPKVLGYLPADVSPATRVAGSGFGAVGVRMVNSPQVPSGHVFSVTFTSDPDSVHALRYVLTDTTTHTVLYSTGNIFDGSLNGQIASGVLPVVATPSTYLIDTVNTGFAPGSPTNARLTVLYKSLMSKNRKRDGFPDDLTIRFASTILDTSVGQFPFRPLPVKFTVIAHTANGDKKLPFKFFDLNGDSTLSHVEGATTGETIQIMSGGTSAPPDTNETWWVQLTGDDLSTRTPADGDVYNLRLLRPFTTGDVFTFSSTAEKISADLAKQEFKGAPYVVPNPYVGAASFEPAPFGVQGRGDRRIEFRNLPQSCTIRIFTVRGDLVQTLRQDGTTGGYAAWDLRTKDNLDAAPGLYIYHIDAAAAGTFIGKFAIIK